MQIRLICSSLLAVSGLTAQFISEPRIEYAASLGPPTVASSIAVNSHGEVFALGGSAGCDIVKLDASGGVVACLDVSSARPVIALALDRSDEIYALGNVGQGARIAKLNPDANETLYTTTITGAKAAAIAVDSVGRAYIAGTADGTFTPTPGAYQGQLPTGASSALFAARLSSTGQIDYATYAAARLGDFVPPPDYGSGPGTLASIAVDSKGELWIAATVPVIIDGGPTPAYGGAYHVSSAFLEEIDAAGTKSLFSIGIGAGAALHARENGYAAGIALDAEDAAYFVGSAAYAPTTPGALRQEPVFQGEVQPNVGFLVKFSPSGRIVYGTYLGLYPEAPTAVVVDESGHAAVALNNAGASEETLCGDYYESSSTLVEILNAEGSAVLAAKYLSGVFTNLIFGPVDPRGTLTIAPTSFYAAGTSPGVFFARPGPIGPPSSSVAQFEATVVKVDLTRPAGPEFDCRLNGASLAPDPIAYPQPSPFVSPGEMIVLFGRNLPKGTNVVFDGQYTAPLIYEDLTRIYAVAPFEIMPGSVTNIWLTTGEGNIGPIVAPVLPVTPAIAPNIINQDGTVNSSSRPAPRGSVVTVYMTGLGTMSPPIEDGATGPLSPPFPAPVIGLSASVGITYRPAPDGIAEILFAGQAPGLIAGIVQLNIRIPEAAAVRSDTTLYVYVGNYYAERGIAVQ